MFGFFKKKSGEVPEEQERLQKAAAREAERREAPEVPEELPTAETALERVKFYRSEGRSLKEAAKLAAADTGYSKNELYELALRAKD